jgi:ornithine decarboxylase
MPSDALSFCGGIPRTDYINDGVYGSFNCIMFDHQIVHPFPLTLGGQACPFPAAFPPNIQLEEDLTVQMGYAAPRGQAELASIWGPTCDSIDCVRNVVVLPKALEVGDWLGWGEMGAYTICAASTFNGCVFASRVSSWLEPLLTASTFSRIAS